MKRFVMAMMLVLLAAAGCEQKKTEEAAKEEPAKAEEAQPEAADQKQDAPDAAAKGSTTGAAADAKEDPFAPPENVSAPPQDAQKTESGLAYVILAEGEGEETPEVTSTVTAHYTGWTTDGKMFDSSHKRGRPLTAPLNNLIKGWQEGIAMMKKGEKRRLWIPEELAYQGKAGAPQGMLVFDVELIDFKK